MLLAFPPAAAPMIPAAQAAYDQPPPTSNPQAPGTSITPNNPQMLDQADPFVTLVGGHYLLFTSLQEPGVNLPERSGTVLGKWGPVSDALPELPDWAGQGWAWAPDIHWFGNHYVLYFTTLLNNVSPPTMCIGDAVSIRATGPYFAESQPFVCQQDLGGSIDPRTFVDGDGTVYLLWKSDQNSRSNSTDTTIYSEPLSPDGLHLTGAPTQIFGPDEPWQGSIVEAPDLVQVEGAYYLFYSGSWFNQPGYAIGVARCTGPLGPCADYSETPLLASNAQGTGPGEESLFIDNRGIWMLYSPFHSAIPNSGPARPATVTHLGFGPNGAYLAATPTDPART
jgi:beta-xylosidase